MPKNPSDCNNSHFQSSFCQYLMLVYIARLLNFSQSDIKCPLILVGFCDLGKGFHDTIMPINH